MAVTVGNQTIWSARILGYLDKLPVYRQAFTNTDYEGEAKLGGTVKAFYINDVSVTDYEGGWDDADWSDLTDNEAELVIDQKKKVLFKVGDVDQQGNVIKLVDQGSLRAAQAIADTIDQYIASRHTQIAAGNAYGDSTTPIVVGFGDGEVKPTLALARLSQEAVEAKAPTADLRTVIPPWFATMLLTEIGARPTGKGDTTLETGVQQGLLEGVSVSGFRQIFASNNVPNTAGEKYKVIGGTNQITFASAIEKIKVVDLQNDFGTGVKGLYVYGSKIMRGETMVLGTFSPGAYQA